MNKVLEKTKYKVVRTVDPLIAMKLLPWFTQEYQSKLCVRTY